MTTNIKHYASGKVREIYKWNNSQLVIVTTDRISVYDVILQDLIPDKGKVLNQMSIFWLKKLANIVPNHFITSDSEAISMLPKEIGNFDSLQDRTMIVQQAKMFSIECIVRGYLAGSAWREYNKNGKATGLDLPPGLQFADKLPQPFFSASTKTKEGHDENLTMEEARYLVGDIIDELALISLQLYTKAATYAETKGIIIADTKFEFGLVDGQIVLADEILTPDSSRFWYQQEWKPGINPPSLDKQIVRDWLDSKGWNRNPPPPKLSEEIICKTRSYYIKVYEILTGLFIQ